MTDARLEAPSVRAARAPRTKHGRYKIVGRASELAAPDEATDIPRGDVQMESGDRRGSGEQASSSSNTCARTEHAPGMVALTVRRLAWVAGAAVFAASSLLVLLGSSKSQPQLPPTVSPTSPPPTPPPLLSRRCGRWRLPLARFGSKGLQVVHTLECQPSSWAYQNSPDVRRRCDAEGEMAGARTWRTAYPVRRERPGDFDQADTLRGASGELIVIALSSSAEVLGAWPRDVWTPRVPFVGRDPAERVPCAPLSRHEEARRRLDLSVQFCGRTFACGGGIGRPSAPPEGDSASQTNRSTYADATDKAGVQGRDDLAAELRLCDFHAYLRRYPYLVEGGYTAESARRHFIRNGFSAMLNCRPWELTDEVSMLMDAERGHEAMVVEYMRRSDTLDREEAALCLKQASRVCTEPRYDPEFWHSSAEDDGDEEMFCEDGLQDALATRRVVDHLFARVANGCTFAHPSDVLAAVQEAEARHEVFRQLLQANGTACNLGPAHTHVMARWIASDIDAIYYNPDNPTALEAARLARAAVYYNLRTGLRGELPILPLECAAEGPRPGER